MADEKTSLEERLMADIASFSCQVCGQPADDWRVTYGIEGAVPTVRCPAHPIDDFVTRERQEQKHKEDMAKAGEQALDLLEQMVELCGLWRGAAQAMLDAGNDRGLFIGNPAFRAKLMWPDLKVNGVALETQVAAILRLAGRKG